TLADEQTGDLVFVCHIGLPPFLVERLQTQGMSGTLCDVVYQEGKALGLMDLQEDTPVNVSSLLEVGLRSYVGTPIVYHDRLLGAFCLFDTTPHPLSETDHTLLIAIGQQMGVAVENTRLFRDVVRERQASYTLLDIAKALSTTLHLDKLLERTLDELQRVVPYDAASICVLRGEH
ncbi:MAG: GAF domain-containing protein, partial [Chloroflexi bacterium]|nr:GAF domain-containing protein [Chloroflexota bacterium]